MEGPDTVTTEVRDTLPGRVTIEVLVADEP